MADYNNISDNDYESSDDDNLDTVVYGRALLQSIFEENNIKLLKKVLETMTPVEVYRIVGDLCFTFRDDDEYQALDNIKCFKYLIKRGLPIETVDEKGYTPLANACMYNDRAISYLLEKGANPNTEIGNEIIRVNVFYHYVRDGSIDIKVLQKAFDKGLNMNFLINDGETVFHRGIMTYDKKFFELLDLLILNGFDINYQNQRGETFLHRAYRPTIINSEIIKEFYNRGFNFDLQNNEGIDVITSLNMYGNDRRDEFRATLKNLKETDITCFQKEPECS